MGLLKDFIGSNLLSGIGDLGLKIREAITGKTVLSSEDQMKLTQLANDAEQLQDKMEHELSLRLIEADTQLNSLQAQINLKDSESSSIFKSGWRPFTGWVCASGLAYQLLVRPILPFILKLFLNNVPELPEIDGTYLTGLLTAMMGIGGLRTFEKFKGVTK